MGVSKDRREETRRRKRDEQRRLIALSWIDDGGNKARATKDIKRLDK